MLKTTPTDREPVPLGPPVGLSGSAPHIVQFYRTDAFLADTVARFVSDGLHSGDSVLLIATEAHQHMLLERLGCNGNDLEGAVEADRVVVVDAHETLSRFCTGADVDEARFEAAISPLVSRVRSATRSGRVRAYGEMVDLLWQDRRPEAAVRTEELWNGMRERHGFSLLCAYVMDGFHRAPGSVAEICRRHTHLAPAERAENGVGEVETALLDEIAEREGVEKALRDALGEREQLERDRRVATGRMERITRITAAIAAAVTPEQVYEAVVDNVATSLGASSAGLWVVDADGRTANLVRSIGYKENVKADLDNVPLDTRYRLPALDAIVAGEPVWIESVERLLERYPHLEKLVTPGKEYPVACLPLGTPARCFGCLALTFEGAAPFDAEGRDLLLLVARYTGQALERLRLLQDSTQARQRAELLHGLARSVITAESVEPVYKAALGAIRVGLGTERASVLSFDGEGVMRFRAWRGLSERYRAAVEGHSPWSADARDPEPIFVPDVEQAPDLEGLLPLLRSEGIGALAFVPLVTGGRLLGKFMLYYPEPRRLTDAERATARAIADHVAAAVNRFDSLEALQRTLRFNEMFAGVLGHDLRNPLGAIMTAAQLLQMIITGDERTRRPISRIISSGERMSRMIDQLLDFTRIRVGAGLPVERRPSDVTELLRQVMDELEMATPEAWLRLERQGDGEGSWDEDRLGQLFSNLLGNAIQHGEPRRPITVRVDGSADPLRVDVHNHGTIAPELLPRLFEPMAGTDRRWGGSQGLGLGLYIARQIAMAHGGEIDVRSSEEEGTTFTLSLPRGNESRPARRAP